MILLLLALYLIAIPAMHDRYAEWLAIEEEEKDGQMFYLVEKKKLYWCTGLWPIVEPAAIVYDLYLKYIKGTDDGQNS